MTASFTRDLVAALVEELGVVVGAMIDSPATVEPVSAGTGRQWVVQIQAEGALTGTLHVALDREGATAMTRLMTGVEGAIPDEAFLDTLREVFAQVVSAVAGKPVARGAKLAVQGVAASDSLTPEGESTSYGISAEKLRVPLAVTTWGSVTVAPVVAPRPAPVPVEDAAASVVAAEGVSEETLDERIGVILDIDLPLVVRFGRTELPLRAITRLGPGSVIDLGKSPDDPVEVLVSNRVVARGEVVIVSGSYGIRILDVVSQRERMEPLRGA